MPANNVQEIAKTFLTVIGVIATVFGCVFAIIAVTAPQIIQIVLPPLGSTAEPEIVYITQPAPTPLPTSSPLPTDTPYPKLATLPVTCMPPPTYTPYPTYTPFITPTSSPTPEVTVSLPFEDSFDTALRPEWIVTSGDWRIANGRLTTIIEDRWSYIFVGDPRWRNYGLEVDFAGPSDPIAIAVRVQDSDNLVQFQLELDDSYWRVRQRGEWQTLITGDGTYWHQPSNTSGRLRVEVKQDFFSAYLDDELWISITDDSFSSGYVGLGTYCQYLRNNCKSFDDFRVYRLTD